MSDPCQSQLQAAAKALGDYRAAQAKVEQLDQHTETAHEGAVHSIVLEVLADRAGKDEIETKAEDLRHRMNGLESFLEELQEQAQQAAQDALNELDQALDDYCDCVIANHAPAQAIDPGEEEGEDEDEWDDALDEIDSMLEELQHEFEALEDDLYGDD
jgi:hypothetical protein